LAAVELDRQAIERRDFPIARRGYDPAAVDAHLRSLALELEALQQRHAGAGGESLASAAATQVRTILEAAETTAADIERRAAEDARQLRESAERDAETVREEAIEKARAQVAAVAEVAATLLDRVGGMDGEVRALVESLRAGAGRLAADLAAVEGNMTELYDAASGRARGAAQPEPPPPAEAVEEQRQTRFEAELADAIAEGPPAAEAPVAAAPAAELAGGAVAAPPQRESGDIDGARLIALNMALNGESRADTERYLAENFELADRGKLVEEVFAAIEG
jgi:DivIVA domain-containing protein